MRAGDSSLRTRSAPGDCKRGLKVGHNRPLTVVYMHSASACLLRAPVVNTAPRRGQSARRRAVCSPLLYFERSDPC
jgi:hypothetical protein